MEGVMFIEASFSRALRIIEQPINNGKEVILMGKEPYVKTVQVSDFGICKRYETRICERGGKIAVTGYGWTEEESRRDAFDKFLAKKAAEITRKK